VERRRVERARGVLYQFLETIISHQRLEPLLNEYVEQIRNLSGCSAAGIRMRSQQAGIPCRAYDGFSPDDHRFQECRWVSDDQCLCTVLTRQSPDERSSCFTEGGSVYFNRAETLRDSIPGKAILGTPPLSEVGYESFGIVPIRIQDRMLGLIYSADSGQDKLSPETIGLLELAALQLGPVVERFHAEESLRQAHEQLESQVRERTLELRATNQVLQTERNTLRGMLDAMADGVYIVNPQHEIEYLNPALASDFGPVLGRKCHEYFNDLPEPCSWCKNREVFAGNSVRWEWTFPKSGKTYELFDTPTWNESGAISKLVFFHDITEKKKAEAALERSETRHRTLVETMAEGLGVTDENFLLTYANRLLCEMLGYSREELVGRHVSEIVDPTCYPALEQHIASLKEGGGQRSELVCVRRDGGRIPVLISPKAILDGQGHFIGSFAVLADLTELKKAEASLRESESQLRSLSFEILKAQEKERKRIAGDLHDDLGQALTTAKLQIGYIGRKLPEGDKELKEQCAGALRHISHVLDKIRTLSRHLNPIIVEDLGLRAALQNLIDEFAGLTEVQVSLSMDNIEPFISREAAVIVYRIFQETFTNISKHAGAKQVSVVIIRREESVSYTVTDDGRGFDADRATAGKPAGLGLLTMRERVHMLGGVFDLWSQPGKGTRIGFSVPIVNSGAL